MEYVTLLRAAVVSISAALPSTFKQIVDRYLPFVAPSARGLEFPVNYQPHSILTSRSVGNATKMSLIYHHLNSTFDAFYSWIKEPTRKNARVFESRYEHLATFTNAAAIGRAVVKGDIMNGHYLEDAEQRGPWRFINDVLDEERRQERVEANAARGRGG